MSAPAEIASVDCRALKQVYQRMGLSGAEVARLVHVHRSAVCRWASGERNPSLLQLMRLTTTLGVPFWQIATTYEENDRLSPPRGGDKSSGRNGCPQDRRRAARSSGVDE